MGNTVTATSRKTIDRYPTWEYDLLRALGGNPTNLPASLEALNRIAQHESVTTSANNWLAVSAPPQYPLVGMNGTLANNPDYIATFPTMAAGVTGLAEFFRNSTYSQGFLKELLNPNATAQSIAASMAGSSWGPGDAAAVAAGANSDPTTYVAWHQPGQTEVGPGGATPGQGSTDFRQCTGATIIGGAGFNLLNTCQAKALVGGFLTAAGLVIIAGGFAIMFSSYVAAATGLLPGLDYRTSPKSGSGSGSSSGTQSQSSETPRQREDRVADQMVAEGKLAPYK